MQRASPLEDLRPFKGRINGLHYFWRNMPRWSHIVLRRRPYHRNAGHFRYSIDKLLLLVCAGTCCINDNVIAISRCLAKQVKDGYAVRWMCLAEGVTMNIDLSEIGHPGQPCHLGRISQLVIPKVHTLKGEQALHTSK
jgi:hypothetical protein